MTFEIKKSGYYEARVDLGEWGLWKAVRDKNSMSYLVADRSWVNPKIVRVVY